MLSQCKSESKVKVVSILQPKLFYVQTLLFLLRQNNAKRAGGWFGFPDTSSTF